VFAKRITCQLWCGLLVLIIAGCGGAPPSTTMTGAQPNTASSAVNEINQSLSLVAAQSGDSADYRIGPDDLLQMTIYNIPEQDARVTPRVTLLRVSQDGLIVAPLVGTAWIAVIRGRIQRDQPKAQRGVDAPMRCVARKSHGTLKCSAHSPATETPWPSSHVTNVSCSALRL